MELSVAKLLNNHGTTVTYNFHEFLSRSIKKGPTVMIQYGNSQVITVFFNLIFENKFLLCYTVKPV